MVGLTRSPSNLVVPKGSGGSSAGEKLSDPNLTMIAGSVTSKADVAKVFEGGDVDGCVIALGGKTSDVGKTMLQDGTKVRPARDVRARRRARARCRISFARR